MSIYGDKNEHDNVFQVNVDRFTRNFCITNISPLYYITETVFFLLLLNLPPTQFPASIFFVTVIHSFRVFTFLPLSYFLKFFFFHYFIIFSLTNFFLCPPRIISSCRVSLFYCPYSVPLSFCFFYISKLLLPFSFLLFLYSFSLFLRLQHRRSTHIFK